MLGKCPVCDELYEVEDSAAGLQADCPACGKTITIAAAPREAIAAPPPPMKHRSPGGGLIGYQPPPTRGRAGGRFDRVVKAVGLLMLFGLLGWGAYFAKNHFLGSSSINKYAGILPEQADMVGYVDLASLFEEIDSSEALKASGYSLDDALGELARDTPLKRLKQDDFRDVCFGMSVRSEELVAVVRLSGKQTLKELLDADGVTFAEHQGVPYAALQVAGNWLFAAELKPGVFAVTGMAAVGLGRVGGSPDAAAIEAVIERHVEKVRGDFSDALRKAVSRVDHHDLFIAASLVDAPGQSDLDWLGFGGSLGSSISFSFVAQGSDEPETRKAEKDANDGLQKAVEGLKQVDDQEMKRAAKLAAGLVEAVRVKRQGAELSIAATWKRAEFDALAAAIPDGKGDQFKRAVERHLPF